MHRSSPIAPFDLSKGYVIATNGVLPALDAHLLTNLPESIVFLDTEKDRTDLTAPEDVLYFVKATRTIYYFYNNIWHYVSGNPTGGSTSTATISVSTTNEITANIKTSSTSGNIIEIKSDGLYAKETSHSSLATKTYVDTTFVQKELQTGSNSVYKVLSDYNFSSTYKNLLDNPSTIISVATTDSLGTVKVGSGLTIAEDGTLATTGTNINLKGAWSSSVTYAVADMVTYQGSSYIATTANTNKNPATSSTDWTMYIQKGEAGEAGSLEIGTVDSGTTASATITGTAPNQKLNLVIPKGDKGDAGEKLEGNYIDVTSSSNDGYLVVPDDSIPVSVEINGVNYDLDDGTVLHDTANSKYKIPVSFLLAQANLNGFSGIWRVWRAGGKAGTNGGSFTISLVENLPETLDPNVLYLLY